MFAKTDKTVVTELYLPVAYSKLKPYERAQVRLAYIRKQNGKCYLCKGNINGPSLSKQVIHNDLYPIGFFKYPIHLHHNHDTDMTIGAVHCYCNAVLWEHYYE